LGENVSDLLGLQLAHRAYRLSLGGSECPVLDGYTGEQRFFLSFAQMWRGVQRPEALREQLRRGPHSPAPCRVNGAVRNVDAWYDAFSISREDKLYLIPEERVHLW
jgi:predicted metalloendopeptidase